MGELESSKSAMKTLAPELSALMIILRSTGPVISTRRSRRSAGMRGARPVALAHGAGLGEEVEALARVEPGLHGRAARQELPEAGREGADEPGHERHRLVA